MKMKTVEFDQMLWTRQRPINPEVMKLVEELLKAKKGVTYEVELDKPMKSLKLALKKHVKAAVKAKDTTGKNWFIKLSRGKNKETVKN